MDTSGPRTIHGWIFELDDVLYDATAWRRWLLQLLSKMGLYTHYDAFFRLWDLEFAPRVHTGQLTFKEALETYLATAGMSPAHIGEVIPALRAQYKKLSTDQRPLPGVFATLKALAATDCQLAVSADTNLQSDALESKLSRLGLSSCFDFVGTSLDTGQLKPAPHGYTSALVAMKLDVHSVAFVGHDVAHLDGALSLGLHTVALDCPAAVDATWHIERFTELISLGTARQELRRAG